MARPPVLTPEVLDRVRTLAADGATVAETAAAVGVSERSVTTARRRLRESGDLAAPAPVTVLSAAPLAPIEPDQIERALVVSLLRAANAGRWRAAAWFLERAYPERWGPPSERPGGPDPLLVDETDPFAEVDEIAARRRR